jgi:phage terminase large subunit
MPNEINEQEIQVTGLFYKTNESKKKYIVNIGGAGSSKTQSVLQHLIFNRLLRFTNYKLLIIRKYRHSNKLSIYKTFLELLNEYNLFDDDNNNKSDLTYNFPDRNNFVQFAGIDDREKMKSTEWHDILIEESNELVNEDFLFLITRLYRGSMMFNTPRIYMNLNPVDCWLRKYEGHVNFDFIWSNYKDNPFANKEYIQSLEDLKDQDETYYQIYALGRWGVLKDLVYKPYKILRPEEYPDKFDDQCYGLDFGYNSPTALIHIGYKDQARYLTEKIYQTKLTNADLINILREVASDSLFEKQSIPIYADSEDPNRIKEIYDAGFNILPAEKGPNSVKLGVDYCKRNTYFSTIENINLNKENSSYKYCQDKQGNLLDVPVKFNNHLMDAKRYADHNHSKKQDLRIL